MAALIPAAVLSAVWFFFVWVPSRSVSRVSSLFLSYTILKVMTKNKHKTCMKTLVHPSTGIS